MATTTINRNTDLQRAREVDSRLAEIANRINRAMRSLTQYKNTISMFGEGHFRSRHAVEMRDKLVPQIEELRAEMDEINANEYTGWTRFFFVKHLHSSTTCSSFRWNTQVAWCPEISGLTEEEAVAEYGATLCTICFKSAPVEGSRA